MGRQSAKNRRRLAWAGTAVVLGGGINLLQHGLGAVHLRSGVLALITALIIVVTTLVSVLQELHTRRDAIAELEESLDAVVACWPPRSATGLTPYDVGVRPDLADVGDSPPYVGRDRDPDIDAAIRETGIAVVFGPPAAGKSRSAFEAVRRVAPDAAMVIPTGGDGLRKVMQQAKHLPLFEQPTVLWLDGLERFAELLDVDPIDTLVHPDPRPQLRDRIRRRPADPPRMIVVATIRSDDLEGILGEGTGATHEMRRLLAHARGIPLEETLSADEKRRFEDAYEREPDGHTVAEAFPRTWSEGWAKPAPREPIRERRGLGSPAWLGVLPVAFLVLAAILIREVHEGGWTEPPPLKTQVSQLSDTIRPCQRLDTYPKDGNGLGSRDVLVAIVHGGDCPMSDEVRFYRLKSKRLRQISALVPADLPPPAPRQVRQTFSCIGDSRKDPCHVRLAGSSSVIVGAFKDTDAEQELPVTVSFSGDKGLALSALSPPAGPTGADATLRLRVGSAPPTGGGCQPSRGCVRGRTAPTTGVLGATDEHPAVLLAGYLAAGSIEAPKALRIRAWRITLPPDRAPRAQRGRNCVALVEGTPVSLRQPTRSALDPRGTLFTGVAPKGSQLMC